MALDGKYLSSRSVRALAAWGLSLILGLMVLLPATTTSVAAAPLTDSADIEALLEDRIRLYGGLGTFLRAKDLGLTVVMGKSIDVASEASGSLPASTGNVGIGVHPTKTENEPTVVANPEDEDKLVAGSHFAGPPAPTVNRCVAYRSTDGGATWSAPFAMPQLTASSGCSDPVLAYAPDGSRVYYAYMDLRPAFFAPFPILVFPAFDILVSYSDNDGATWTGPVVALDGDDFAFNINTGVATDPGFDYDKPWIGTHVAVDEDDDGQANKNWAYVSATRFDFLAPSSSVPFSGNCHIDFTRSANKAVSWSGPVVLDSSTGGCAGPVVVQGSRPTGGLGNRVLVAWYNSGTDGWLTGNFQIRTRHSANNGGTFGPIVAVVTDSSEAPFWLGPFAFYHRWWGTMFPDVEVSPDGVAHVVYTHDPAPNGIGVPFFVSTTPEDGDIRYISSSGAPYSSWSTPVTLNDDGLVRAQGYAALETSQGDDDDVTLHVIWEDHRLSPTAAPSFPVSSNLFFDMFYTTWEEDDGWAPNSRITDASSINDFSFIGDYNDITTADDGLIYAVWTDRRHQTSIFPFEDNVFGTSIGDDD